MAYSLTQYTEVGIYKRKISRKRRKHAVNQEKKENPRFDHAIDQKKKRFEDLTFFLLQIPASGVRFQYVNKG